MLIRKIWQDICGYLLETRLDYTEMEYNFIRVEGKLALDAWMMQAFRLEDKVLEEEFEFEDWMFGNDLWISLN